MGPSYNYKKPSRINPVSLSFVLVLGLLGYVGYCFWPALSLRADAKSTLADFVPPLYRVNLLGEAIARPESLKIKKSTIAQLRKVGVTDKDLDVTVQRDKKTVALLAEFKVTVVFPGIDKKLVLNMAPRVETSAARIDW